MNWLAVIAIVALVVLPQLQNSSELTTILQRATEYVARYEQELGNLIGTEEYIQNSTWSAKDTAGYLRVAKRQRQRVSSDFLIIQVGPEWAAVRKVNKVDGLKVKEENRLLRKSSMILRKAIRNVSPG